MFAESMILHAITESAESEVRNAQAEPANQVAKENRMAITTTEKTQAQQQGQQKNQQTSLQQLRANFVDPLGRPLHHGAPRFTDQQVGGDLTGDESDARDDNYIETGIGQNARDVSAHAGELPPASAELLRYVAVAPVPAPSPPPTPAPDIEPDGTEDPGANADDGLVPRNQDGAGSEQH